MMITIVPETVRNVDKSCLLGHQMAEARAKFECHATERDNAYFSCINNFWGKSEH